MAKRFEVWVGNEVEKPCEGEWKGETYWDMEELQIASLLAKNADEAKEIAQKVNWDKWSDWGFPAWVMDGKKNLVYQCPHPDGTPVEFLN